MIGTIDVEIMAANPSMPLYPMRAFKNSPSSIRLRNVPKHIGNWNITSVQIVAAYPDSSIRTANCVLVGGVWVGTIEGCPISGRSENGFTVFASGIDENGNPVSNYVLGKGLIEILEGDGTITPDAPSYYVHLLDQPPATPKEGDLWRTPDGIWFIRQGNTNKQLDKAAMDVADSASSTASAAMEAATSAGGIASSAMSLATNINAKIPAQATTQNQLADKAFVNSSVQTATANFRGNWATWSAVPLSSNQYPQDYTGSTTPTVNDYLVVQDASGYDGQQTLEGTWRFKYSGTWDEDGKQGWLPEYQVNETPMTSAQLAALNSNITAAKVSQYDETFTNISYELVNLTTTQTPVLIDSLFPMEFTPEGESEAITITKSQLTVQWTPEDNVYDIVYQGDSIFFTDTEGYFEGMTDEGSITFNGVTPTQSTQVLELIPDAYNLQDRAVNTINIGTSTTKLLVNIPPRTLIGHARDFIVRVVAAFGSYSTAPTLGVTSTEIFLNSGGNLPEIKTDFTETSTTLFYFSEIGSNIFLVKGEQLEIVDINEQEG